MHYRNGREAKNGDKIVKLDERQGRRVRRAAQRDAGQRLLQRQHRRDPAERTSDACMVDCLHVDDVAGCSPRRVSTSFRPLTEGNPALMNQEPGSQPDKS
jgi:hypothetical protein